MFPSSRAVFLLGTLFAIFGTVEANEAPLSTCTGAGNTAYRAENNPGGSGVIACKCVPGYSTNNGIVLGDTTLSCTRCAPGYYFSAGDGTVGGAVCTQAPANKYWAGLYDFSSNNDSTDVETVTTSCPTNSESVAGSTTLADCKVKPGFHISTAANDLTNSGNTLAITAAPADSYATGGAAANANAGDDAAALAATLTACPFGGNTNSQTGKSALTDCVPDCATTTTGSNAVAAGGTCVCKSTHYGAPQDANGATLAAVTQGCTACPAGKFMQTAYTASYAGAGDATDCVVQPGIYIQTANADVNAVVVGQVGKNQYSVATDSDASATAPTQCPYAGETVQAGNSLADCTPSCGSGINTVAIGGTCRCAATHYGIPEDANGATAAVATQGCTPCPTNSETAYTSAVPSGTLADCKVKPGYYISRAANDLTNSGNTLVITSAPAGTYATGGAAANANAGDDFAALAATISMCSVKSSSEAGSDEISDCKVSPGFYLSVASPSSTSAGRIARSATNHYAAGGTPISATSTETDMACPYAGTSPIGSSNRIGCTPSCGTVAVASSGTCVCKAGRTGTPTPTNAAVTGGCAAITCDANKYVSSNTCSSCPAGTTNAAGDDASGDDTSCDATLCAANQYVSSNTCSSCPAGTTNAAGDDASGIDTECDSDISADVVSGSSRKVHFFVAPCLMFATLMI